MSNNLLELINENIKGDVIAKIAEFLGESSNNTSSALTNAVPSLIAGLISKSTESQGADSILNLLSQDGHDGSVLANLTSAFSGNNLLSTGTSLLSTILGDKTEGVANLISNTSGISKTSSSSLLGLLMPIVLGVLGKTIKEQGITNASGLAGLLGSQMGYLEKFLPQGLSNLFDIGNLSNFKQSSAAVATKIIPENKDKPNSLLPWLLIMGLLGLAWGFFKYFGADKPSESIAQKNETTSRTIAAKTLEGDENTSDLFVKTLSSGFAIKATKDGVESKLITFIEDANKSVDKGIWFNMNGIVFDTGKAKMKPESNEQLTNISEILKVFPKVKIKIGGYTDNTGNPKDNQILSAERAKTVQNELIAKGIDSARIESEGYGSDHPVASNDTEDGRQQNRRIDLNVTEK